MIERRERWALVASAVRALGANDRPWRTHIQKLLYFSDAWAVVPLHPYSFVIHRFGPYSFDLDHDIADMRAFGALIRIWAASGMGATYEVSDAAEAPYRSKLDALAEWLGPKGVRDLETLATVEFVRVEGSANPNEDVVRLKPHISEGEVEAAIKELDEMRPILAQT